jgi:hypothetical protein
MGVIDDGHEAVHFHMLMEKSRELVAECAGTLARSRPPAIYFPATVLA